MSKMYRFMILFPIQAKMSIGDRSSLVGQLGFELDLFRKRTDIGPCALDLSELEAIWKRINDCYAVGSLIHVPNKQILPNLHILNVFSLHNINTLNNQLIH